MRHASRILALAAILAAGCDVAEKSVKIGFNLELTGDIQAVGQSSQNAAQLFFDQLNAAGGVQLADAKLPVELVIRDNAANTAQSASVAQELVAKDNVTAMIGPNSSTCAVAAAGIAEALKCVMISPWSTDPRTTIDEASGVPKRYAFRACFTDPFQAQILAKFAKGRLGASRAAVLFETGAEIPRSQAELFRETFTAAGGQIVAFETYRAGDRDCAAPLGAIAAAAPDLIYLPAYAADVPPIARQARQLGLNIPLLGSDAWTGPDLLRLGGADLEGSYVGQHFSPQSEAPEVKKFVADYTARFGTPPDDVAALTYDACGLVTEALTAAGQNSREAVRESFAKIRDYRGVTGTFRFEPGSGDPLKSAVIMRVQDGAFVWETEAAP